MRVTIEHPAIVSGHWKTSGDDRHDLVRVPTEFEIREFAVSEAPLAFKDSRIGHLVRLIAANSSAPGRLFRICGDGKGLPRSEGIGAVARERGDKLKGFPAGMNFTSIRNGRCLPHIGPERPRSA